MPSQRSTLGYDHLGLKETCFVPCNSSQYPQHISFQATQDRCSLLDGVNVGDTVTVHFNLRGREWTSPQGEIKYFNTLEAWKIDRTAAGSTPSQPAEYAENIPAQDKDDLPF